jgi:glutamate formiminotransferase
MQRLFEIVPNISEGRDDAVVAEAARAMERAGVRVAHVTRDPVHNRSVITAFGDARSCVNAAPALAEITTRLIDLRAHSGVHPRIGALDVLPFVPIANATLAEAAALAHEAAALIWERLRVPSFFYEDAAREGRPRLLAQIRRGGFEELPERAARGETPDVGDIIAHPSAGAIAVGARPVLTAFNIVLSDADIALGRRIARTIREKNGGLRTLRALGLALPDGRVQISCNITDARAVPLHRLLGVVRRIAARNGASVEGCELIGLAPRHALAALVAHELGFEVETPMPA